MMMVYCSKLLGLTDMIAVVLPINEYYIVAENLIPSISQALQRPIKVLTIVDPSIFEDTFYRHCFYNNVASPLVSASHVSASIGTGLVHTSYAHGFDDYKIALSRNEKIECFVDEEGKYMRQMGYDLEGKDVITQGSKAVLQLLKKNVVHSYNYIHSYPYDWRTKKPVIIRSSKQWFIDVSTVSQKAVEFVDKNLKIDQNQKASLIAQLAHRPAWCISRQRAWGVPIPAIIDSQNEAHINSKFIQTIAEKIREKNDTDYWWKASMKELLEDSKIQKSLNLSDAKIGEMQKGSDIMDVWVDSGVAWHTIGKDKVANCVSEGIDQFRGWFQSLILTSLAARDLPPYKQILVHGFSVDEKNRKMSKSIGNVIDPDSITDGTMNQKALGADGLRLWVALYGSEGTSDVKLGSQVLNELELKLKQIRNIYKFLLGALDGYHGDKPKQLRLLDK
uniref:isoleucine--tRNA ligase n=1 Tax=Panagrolaimus superbus TaxID=310955 RepID=A0A914Y9R3_9BILA